MHAYKKAKNNLRRTTYKNDVHLYNCFNSATPTF